MFGRGRERQKIEGRIIAMEHTGVGAWNGIGGQKKYVVEYSAGGSTKRVQLKQVMGLNSYKMKSPKVGSTVPLLLDERSGKVEFDIEDPRLALDNSDFLREDSKADHDAYESALNGGPMLGGGEASGGHAHDQPDPQVRRARVALREARRAGDPAEVERLAAELERLEHPNHSQRSPSRSAPGAESIEHRLATLQQLRDGGALTPDEYAAQRQRILDSI